MESGREQNYWPGFVDAMSNVVLTLVFVLVIFVFALAITSSKVEQKLNAVAKEVVGKKLESKISLEKAAELEKQLEQANLEIKKLRASAAQSQKVESGKKIQVETAEAPQGSVGPVQIKRSDNSIVINFPEFVTEMDAKSVEELESVLAPIVSQGVKYKLLVRSSLGHEVYSVAQRLAYYRAMNVRNYLLAKQGAAQVSIKVSIVSKPLVDGGKVEVIFENE
jgi:septal ring factor EnvC (AmiA/AmiB activator)